ncbi:MAG: Hsp70 family protein [Planctomycetota bacterium]
MTPDTNTPTPPTDPIVGIDLGTTNSLVAWCNEAGPRILIGPDGEASLPSVVRLDPDTGRPEAIGAPARASAVAHPTQTIHSAKRLMGRGLADVAQDAEQLPYTVVEGDNHTARIKVGEHIVSPQAISAMILSELKRWAEHALQTEVRRAVVTVPAYFDDAQRQATRDAGRLAGLEVVRIVNEPTAAALAYGLGEGPRGQGAEGCSVAKPTAPGTVSLSTKLNPAACASDAEPSAPQPPGPSAPSAQTVAVYDLGGGTFDISVLKLQHTEQGQIDQVIATAGDTHLGGDDVDRMIIDLVTREIGEQLGQAVDFPPATRQALRSFAEQTKIKLSTDDRATIEIDLGSEQGKYQRVITRDELEAMIEPWLERTLAACRSALHAAKLDASAIDRVVLVGGSTRIPAVRRAVEDLFEREPYTALDPDQVVALGASVQAARLAGNSPGSGSGAGGGLLLDVIPLSLGIETMGGAVAKLITANSTIPARATETFSTHAEGQTKVAINVYQGERELVQDCRLLGQFELGGIPPMPAGLPKLEVTFLVDANGVLTVHATEQRSGRAARIQVIPNHGLTRDEVDRIERDAYDHAKDDMQRHRLIDLKLNAKLDIRNIQKQLDRVGDELDPAYRNEIEQHIATVQGYIDADENDNIDADAFHQAMTDMDHATIRLAETAIAQTLRDRA